MKKSLLALIVAGSFALAGCSSSGGAGNSDADRDVDPEWGVVPPAVQPPMDDSPEWGLEPPLDRPQPDFGDTPEWGVEVGERPEKLPPTWGGECGSPDGGANCDPIPPKPPTDIDNDWGISTDPEVSPAINSIDRNKVRDALRSRLNG